jgi:L-ribulose-5-phosphate 4-epimerase
MLEKLKAEVLAANLELPARGLVTYTWGNVSGIDRQQGLVVIKPSGVSYEKLQVEDLVVVDLAGNIKEGKLTPSSDTATHLVLYREFENIGGVVHTHSTWATIWSQLGRKIPPCGTTHADYFYGDIPCTRKLSGEEIHRDYEQETGLVIAETMTGMNPQHCPAVLVNDHGPFSWGETPAMAVHNAVVLEEVAKMAYYTELMQQKNSMDKVLMNKHFLRKHGKNAYYGQR